MPRFYLHVRRGGALVADPEGAIFADLEAAKQEAIQSAREVAAESLRFGTPIQGQIEIDDEGGKNLLVITFREAMQFDD